MFMLIYGHWQHLSNTSSVTSVNAKTGAVTLNATEIPYSDTKSTKAKIDEVEGKVTVQHYVTQDEYDEMEEAGTLVADDDYNIIEQ